MTPERVLLQRMVESHKRMSEMIHGGEWTELPVILRDARALLATPEAPRPWTRADIEALVAKVSAFEQPNTIWVGYTKPDLIDALCAAAGLEGNDE